MAAFHLWGRDTSLHREDIALHRRASFSSPPPPARQNACEAYQRQLSVTEKSHHICRNLFELVAHLLRPMFLRGQRSRRVGVITLVSPGRLLYLMAGESLQIT